MPENEAPLKNHSNGNFFSRLFRKPEEIKESRLEVHPSARNVHSLLEKLNKVKLSRRQFIFGLGLPTAALLADEVLTKGKFLYYGVQLITNQEFRDKLLESIRTGEITQDIEQLGRTLQSETPPSFTLGETIESTEEWLATTFTNQEIKVIYNTETKDARTLLVATVGQVEIIQAVTDEIGAGLGSVNFSRTAEAYGPFATLPTNQQSLDSRTNSWVPRLYSAYQTTEGLIEYQDASTGDFNPRGGALVIIDNKPLVVDSSQLNNYRVGENCQAIEVIGFVIRSNHLEQDLKDMNDSGSLAATDMINDPRYNSFLATFYDSDSLPHTVLIGTYHHSSGTANTLEWPSNDRLTVARALDLFEQIREEKNYVRFDMQVPDPDFSLVTSSHSVPQTDQISEISSRSSLGDRFDWQYHRVLDGTDGFARVNGRKYFIASKQ